MKTSLNQLNRELKEIAQAHDQINSYHWGDLSDAMTKPIIYPLMNCYVQSGGGFQNNATDIPLVIEIYDWVYKDSSNLNDVESDTKQILRDVYQVINKSTRWKKIGKVNTVTDAKYKWKGADDVAGWAQSISFKLRDVSGVCGLPMDGYDFEQDPNNTAPCADGVVLLDSAPLASVPSGEVVDLHLVDQNDATIEPISIIGGVIKVDQTPIPAPCTGIGEPKGTRGFYELPDDNIWGHSYRFCGITGGYTDGIDYFRVDGTPTNRNQAFPHGLICDLYRIDCDGNFIMFTDNFNISPHRTLAQAVSYCAAFTLGGFSGFIQMNRDHYDAIRNNLNQYILDIPPFENTHTNSALWLNTDFNFGGQSTGAWQLNAFGGEAFTAKADASGHAFPIRITNTSEL